MLFVASGDTLGVKLITMNLIIDMIEQKIINYVYWVTD